MSEKEIGRRGVGRYLVEQVGARGGICEKHSAPGRIGVPDYLVTWQLGQMDLIETKAPSGRVAPWQRRDHARRAKLGVGVFLVWSRGEVDAYIERRRPHWLIGS